jgi:Asp-tRNA(Asn)/Glu-tRNA(Gln) amidotransferase C subunit
MAERRMFAKTIIDSDAFLDMPATSQLLYFHLSMRADDDGFINKPKTIMRICGCKDDDMKLLIAKKFIIPFETGIVVIKHWKIHNYIRNDRYKETKYKEEKATLTFDENNAYTIGIPSGYQMDTQVRLGKDRIELGKDRIEELPDSDEPEPPTKKPVKHKYGEYKNVLLTDDELQKLKTEYSDYEERIERLSAYVASTGKKYKSHYATIRNWARKDAEKPGRKEIVPDWMKKKQGFNNFKQNNYDFDELEDALLANGSKTVDSDPELKARADALKVKLGGA